MEPGITVTLWDDSCEQVPVFTRPTIQRARPCLSFLLTHTHTHSSTECHPQHPAKRIQTMWRLHVSSRLCYIPLEIYFTKLKERKVQQFCHGIYSSVTIICSWTDNITGYNRPNWTLGVVVNFSFYVHRFVLLTF